MAELKQEYEEKLANVTEVADTIKYSAGPRSEKKITERIKSLKDILIGGERANDTQLKEKRYKKKLAAQKKLK